jgi:hypothetical protein
MSRWFRFYDDAINDPKILKLSDKLYRVWVGILCVASKNDGKLPSLDDMALMIRMKPEKLGEAIKSLMISGLIDEDGPILSPHNWNARQFKSDVSTERVQRFRKQQRNVSVTPPETETETEKKEHCADAKAPRTKQEYSDEFETKFWLPYPRSPTMAKKEAWREWMKLGPEQRSAACQAIEPYKRYLRTKPTLETVHACRFLSQRRFEGFTDAASTAPVQDIRSSLV